MSTHPFRLYRTVVVLTLAQCFGHTAAPILVLLGGIVGARIAPSAELATLPIAIQVLGVASAAIPAAMLMSRVGRKAGFLGATALAISASLLAAYAVTIESFALLSLQPTSLASISPSCSNSDLQ